RAGYARAPFDGPVGATRVMRGAAYGSPAASRSRPIDLKGTKLGELCVAGAPTTLTRIGARYWAPNAAVSEFRAARSSILPPLPLAIRDLSSSRATAISAVVKLQWPPRSTNS